MPTRFSSRASCLSLIVLLAGATSVSSAPLQPEEVAVVAPRSSKEGQALAQYYMKKRGIPAGNLCIVDMPKGEVLKRNDWKWAVRPEIYKWITDNDPDEKIRCLVTVWDVPLKISGADKADLMEYGKFLRSEREHRIELIGTVIERLDGLASEVTLSDAERGTAAEASADAGRVGGESEEGPATEGSLKPSEQLKALRQRLESSLRQAQLRLNKSIDTEGANLGRRVIEQLASATGGVQVLAQSLAQRLQQLGDEAPPEARAQFDILRGRISAFGEAKQVIEQGAPSIQRDALVLSMIERFGGLLATIEWIDAHLDSLEKNETGASFDSELSLVMWPDEYQLLRWQPNYLHRNYENSRLDKAFRTLMVSRLDAPDLKITKALVDVPLQVEAAGGLKGKMYLDARGIGKLDQPNVATGSYADYDRALLITAEGIKQIYPNQEVVLDDKPALFQPGECPDAALYCGWYSLAKYVDAFEWVPGAVAYHMASSEATTLRKGDSQVWCKRMLEDGVCATMGPVYEPYLMAFPRPNEFFALLMQGELTLVECYYRTKPFNSWAMTLIGDPLYRPFKKPE